MSNAPFCLVCSTLGRMTRTQRGWKCEGKGDYLGRAGCGNEIDFDCRHIPVGTFAGTVPNTQPASAASPIHQPLGLAASPLNAPGRGGEG